MTRDVKVWECPTEKMGAYLADINVVPREYREPDPHPESTSSCLWQRIRSFFRSIK
ncbi:MAG: hypothetical protein P4L90_25915 [Rhodopila sp.]|nr:hypothetical protein [Rhodopila sp.]